MVFIIPTTAIFIIPNRLKKKTQLKSINNLINFFIDKNFIKENIYTN